MNPQLILILFAAFIFTLVNAQQWCSEHKVEIVCEEIATSTWSIVDSVRICCGDTSITSTIPGSSVSKVLHYNGAYVTNLSEIDALEIDGATVVFIPFGLNQKFTSLRALRIVSSGLVSVKKMNLKQFGESLESLDLRNNKLTSIDADLFEYNHKLKGISLAGNPIKDIGLEFFTNLKNLKEIELVDFSSTACMDVIYEKDEEISTFATFEWIHHGCNNTTSKVSLAVKIDDALCFEEKSARATAKILENVKKTVFHSASIENSMKKSNDELKIMIDGNSKRLNDMEKKLESILNLVNQLYYRMN